MFLDFWPRLLQQRWFPNSEQLLETVKRHLYTCSPARKDTLPWVHLVDSKYLSIVLCFLSITAHITDIDMGLQISIHHIWISRLFPLGVTHVSTVLVLKSSVQCYGPLVLSSDSRACTMLRRRHKERGASVHRKRGWNHSQDSEFWSHPCECSAVQRSDASVSGIAHRDPATVVRGQLAVSAWGHGSVPQQGRIWQGSKMSPWVNSWVQTHTSMQL